MSSSGSLVSVIEVDDWLTDPFQVPSKPLKHDIWDGKAALSDDMVCISWLEEEHEAFRLQI